MRRILAAWLAEACVRELRILPPVILLRGASVSHDAKYRGFESHSLRQVVRDSGESVPGARSGGEFPAMPRGFG